MGGHRQATVFVGPSNGYLTRSGGDGVVENERIRRHAAKRGVDRVMRAEVHRRYLRVGGTHRLGVGIHAGLCTKKQALHTTQPFEVRGTYRPQAFLARPLRRIALASFVSHLPVLLAGSMLQRTPAFGIIPSMLPARRACPAHAGRPVAAALRRFQPSPYPLLKRGRIHANVVRGVRCADSRRLHLAGPATRCTTLNRRAAIFQQRAR